MSNINDFESAVLCVFSEYSEFTLVEIRKAFVICNKSFDLLRRCIREAIMNNINLITHAESLNKIFFQEIEK